MTKYYVDVTGRYLGGFDGAEPPSGAVEVPNAPDHGSDIWKNNAWVPVTPIPEAVAMWQARSVLIDAGLLDDVDAYIAAIPDPVLQKKAKAKWEYSNTVQRHDALLAGLASSLGLTEEQIDEMFIAASKL